jgi:large subunit ribosomal protein L30
MAKKKTDMLKIKYVRSAIGRPNVQKKVVRGLGLTKLQQVVERPDTPEIRGMVNKIGHLVEIIEGDES